MAFRDYLTAEGERLLAKSIADSEPITFTKLVMGSGYLAQGTSEKNVSEVVTPVKTLGIKSVTLNSSTSTVISAYFNNEGLEEGFFFREKAIFIKVGDEEVLGIYGNAGSTAEYVDNAEVCVIEKILRTVVQLTSDEIANVTLDDGTSARCPVILDMRLDEFVNTDTAITITAGQTLILNDTVYYFTGGDQRDTDNYTTGMRLSDEYKTKLPGADEFGGIAVSQNALYEFYMEFVEHNHDETYLKKSSVTNSNTVTEAGFSMDARQANPNVPGSLGAQVAALNNNLTMHKSGSDHDSRYYTKTQIDAKNDDFTKQITITRDFTGVWYVGHNITGWGFVTIIPWSTKGRKIAISKIRAFTGTGWSTNLTISDIKTYDGCFVIICGSTSDMTAGVSYLVEVSGSVV